MKTIQRIISLLPLCAIAAGCTNSEPEAGMKAKEGDFHVMMSVLPAGSHSADGSSTSVGTEDERAFDDDHIYFATYKRPAAGTSSYNGDYLTFIKDGNTLNNTGSGSVEAAYYTPNWGPSVAARLKKDDYKDGFAVGFFSVPANAVSTTFTVQSKTLNNIADIVLKWPASTAEGSTAWAPNKTNGNHIPLGGVVDVTAEYMKNYNENIYTGLSPFPLPNVKPMRAMAKVVIEDPDGLIAKAEMYTASNGCLLAAPNQLFGTDLSLVQPKLPTSRTFFTQQLTAPNGSETEGGNSIATYTFYSYEQSFRSPVAGTSDLTA
ncbi:MAG: hypothetical protein K2H15_02670, partial [Muribaculaceae bacterium]|nr:hypothetical protein [Muribaculaceae bacterium]